MIITIDGPAGSGKSTAARNLAKALGIAYLDTGATYRAVTLLAMRRGTDLTDEDALTEVARRAKIELAPDPDGVRVLLDGEDVSEAIRTPEVTENSRHAAASAKVREVLVGLQRRLGEDLGDFVTEGRDQGSVVFPEATVKFYLDASPEVRAWRRSEELAAAGRRIPPQEILESIRERDRRDRTRAVAPLVKPDGAVTIETTDNTIEETTEQLLRHIRRQT